MPPPCGRKDHSFSNMVLVCFCDDLVGGLRLQADESSQLRQGQHNCIMSTYATLTTPYNRRVMLRTEIESFRDKTTLPWTSVGALSSSLGVMTITSLSVVPILQKYSQHNPQFQMGMSKYLISKRETVGPRFAFTRCTISISALISFWEQGMLTWDASSKISQNAKSWGRRVNKQSKNRTMNCPGEKGFSGRMLPSDCIWGPACTAWCVLGLCRHGKAALVIRSTDGNATRRAASPDPAFRTTQTQPARHAKFLAPF